MAQASGHLAATRQVCTEFLAPSFGLAQPQAKPKPQLPVGSYQVDQWMGELFSNI